MIRILTTNYNTTPFIHRYINSLKAQTITNWKAYITDDLSTDGSISYIQTLIENDDRFELIQNKKKMWQTGNYYQILQKDEIQDSDICVTIDGDDFLHDSAVFERVLSYYNNPNIWMSFGNFIYYDGKNNNRVGFARKPKPFENLRKLPWTSTHLRTFKAFLFRQIQHEDLIDTRTNWYPITAGDVACITPMLEMAGENRVLYTNDINYMYNVDDSAINDYKLRGKDQIETTNYFANKEKYKQL